MMQPGMNSTGIYQVGKCHLVNIAQPLVPGVGNNLQDQRVINCNKTIDRVVDDLANWRHCCFFVKGPGRAGGKSTTTGLNKLFLKGAGPVSLQPGKCKRRTTNHKLQTIKNGSCKNNLGG